jgi:hypothetical protein
MKPLICVDLDGTLAPEPSSWGDGLRTFFDPYPGAKEMLKELSSRYTVMIYTCRTNECFTDRFGESPEFAADCIREWMDKHGLAYDSVFTGGRGKPTAVAFIDDRAIECVRDDGVWTYENVLHKIGFTSFTLFPEEK